MTHDAIPTSEGVAVDHDLISRQRERIALDLNDMALRRLSQLGFELAAIRALNRLPMSSLDRGQIDARIQSAIENVDNLIGELRKLVASVPSAPDVHPGVEVAVRNLLEDAAAQMVSEISVSVEGPVDPMSPLRARHVQAVALEALRNATLHLQASNIAVALLVREDAVELRVTDDAIGLPEVRAQNLGLESMAARARELGGTLSFGPGANSGSMLRWRVPC